MFYCSRRYFLLWIGTASPNGVLQQIASYLQLLIASIFFVSGAIILSIEKNRDSIKKVEAKLKGIDYEISEYIAKITKK